MKESRLDHLRIKLADPPNDVACMLTLQLLTILFANAFLMFKVGPTIEEGLLIELNIIRGIVYVEIYNTGEIAMCYMDKLTKNVEPFNINNVNDILPILETLDK